MFPYYVIILLREWRDVYCAVQLIDKLVSQIFNEKQNRFTNHLMLNHLHKH